jgi:hypothetical protein
MGFALLGALMKGHRHPDGPTFDTAPPTMDLKTLKLELLERIANLEDEARLLALKRLLDRPPTYAVTGDHLTVVREGNAPYLKLEDRMYTAEQVRKVVEEVLAAVSVGASDEMISAEELADLERRHQARLNGESKGSSRKESMSRLRARRS